MVSISIEEREHLALGQAIFLMSFLLWHVAGETHPHDAFPANSGFLSKILWTRKTHHRFSLSDFNPPLDCQDLAIHFVCRILSHHTI
jgi:hypothetical protein